MNVRTHDQRRAASATRAIPATALLATGLAATLTVSGAFAAGSKYPSIFQ